MLGLGLGAVLGLGLGAVLGLGLGAELGLGLGAELGSHAVFCLRTPFIRTLASDMVTK